MSGQDEEGKSAALRLAEEIQRRPLAAAAIAGGAAAAAAAAVMGARALARRNGARKGKPVNQVLAAAITASEAAAACRPEGGLVEEGAGGDQRLGLRVRPASRSAGRDSAP